VTIDKVRVAGHVAEGGHWYTRDGEQVTAVPSADGKREVKPDIRHARKLDLAPGVTSVIRCADRPELTLWKQRQAIASALTLPRLDSETEDAWLRRIEVDMDETARKAAEQGSALHAALQRHLGGEPVPEEFQARCANIASTLDLHAEKWQSELACVSKLGYGTKADLLSSAMLLDVKTKDAKREELETLRTYDSHWMQLWATRRALAFGTVHNWGLRTLPCGILYVSRIEDALVLVPVSEEQLEQGGLMFRALLRYWQAKNRFRPSWAVEES